MSDQNTNSDAALEGERTIASVTAEKGAGRNADPQKRIILASLAMGVAVFLYLGWPRGEPEQVEQRTDDAPVRTTTQFQPADINDPAPPAEVTLATEPAQVQPVGPIERVRQQGQDAASADPTEAELLLLASRRAPVVAFGGGRAATPAPQGNSQIAGTGLVDRTQGQPGEDPGALANALKTTPLEGTRASVIPAPHLTITQGTTIPCNLDTAMDSTLGGMVRCTVTDDIFGTTGTVVLLERGSKIVGEYQGGVQRGQQRLFVIWTRAETPSGVIVALDSPGTDALGRTCFDGVVDTQFWTRFSGTILLSIIDDALAIAANQSDGDLDNTSAGARELAAIELESTINVPVILRKPQGEQVAVMVARDLDFSSVYWLKPH